jgi:nucleoside-diphosphate-sugar epimerase
VLRRAGRLAGKHHGPLPVPWWGLLPVAWGAQGLAFALPPLRGAAERLRLGAGTTQLGSDARARAELGFRPRSLDAGLPDTVRSLLQDVFAAP